ncbi:MAG: HAD family hydrolase [bacterium]
MKKLNEKLIIFDLDGTLYRSETSFFPAVQRFFDEYASPSQTARIFKDNFVNKFIGEPEHVFVNWLSAMFPHQNPIKMKEQFEEYELAAVQSSGQLYPGVMETLDWLNVNDYDIYLCSNATLNYLETIINKFNLSQYFKALYIPQSKQHTKKMMMKEIKEKSGKQSGYAVGDRFHDLQAALANQLFFFGAVYGYAPEEMKPAHKLLSEIKQIIDTLK